MIAAVIVRNRVTEQQARQIDNTFMKYTSTLGPSSSKKQQQAKHKHLPALQIAFIKIMFH